MTITRRHAILALATAAAAAALPALPARAASAEVIDARVNLALSKLWQQSPGARDLADRARGMLVMPRVVKGGLIVGGSYGEGALRLNDPATGYGPTAAYYSVSAASIGLQAGIQTTSHALFFLTDEALAKFRRSDGWEIGADAEVTFPDAGMNVGIDSTSFEKPVVGIVFAEDGLLVGASLEGAKYSLLQR
jgi:lipid-binding SYLF domain-containing protein